MRMSSRRAVASVPEAAFPAPRPRGRGRAVVWTTGWTLAVLCAAAGCQWSTRSGLPDHIKTVSVPMFTNPTTEYGVETRLTEAVRRAVRADPRLQLVNGDADAVLSGRVLRVHRRSVRDNRDDRPSTMQLTLEAEISFYDERAGRYLISEAKIDSGQSASSRGLYYADHDPRKTPEDAAMDSAIDSLAAEIVRRSLAMW